MDECYILEPEEESAGPSRGGPRLVKYAKEEMLQKELPPDESPVATATMPKTYENIGKPDPNEVR